MRTIPMGGILLATLMAASAQVPNLVVEPLANDPAITLVGKAARSVAVSDSRGVLAVGVAGGKLQLFSLQADGTPSALPLQEINLPYPAPLQSVAAAPLSLLFHPQLPLLYVWQEITTPFSNPYDKGRDLARLSIYRLNGANWELAGSYARGENFAYGQGFGSMALSRDGKQLLLPNTIRSGNAGLASYDLDESGLPASDGKAEPTPVMLFFHGGLPVGAGIVTERDGLFITGSSNGILAGDSSPRSLVQNTLGTGGMYLAGAHGTQPILYFASTAGRLVAFDHVDGYLTQMPRVLQFANGTAFSAPPVVLTAKSWLALGATNSLVLVELDGSGWPRPKARVLKMLGRPAQLAYSEKFKRLYVPIQ